MTTDQMVAHGGAVKRALVVHSTEVTSKLTYESLGENFAVELADDYEKGSTLASENSFDVVILNVTESNFEEAMKLASLLKSFDHYLNTPLIVLSETKNTVQLTRAFDVGCDEYLALPVEAVELKARVRARVRDLVPAQKSNFFWAAELRFDVAL